MGEPNSESKAAPKTEIDVIKPNVTMNILREIGNSKALDAIGFALKAIGLREDETNPTSEAALPAIPKKPPGAKQP